MSKQKEQQWDLLRPRPVVANIFMEHVEEEALRTCPHQVRIQRRFVDDTFRFLQESTVNAVLQHISNTSLSIKFTVQQEAGGKLPFLDALVSRKEDGTQAVSVYRKSTHTDQYLSFKSHHPSHVKKGVARCLIKRARDITTDEDQLQKEGNI